MLDPRVMARERARRKVRQATLPAPIGGWNTEDPLAAMSPQYATVLDNWFPSAGKVTVRPGYSQWATGVGAGAVETIAEYNHAGTRKALAASSSALYDISGSGSATSLATGFSNGRWQWTMFHNNMFLCNGQDTPQVFNGSSLSSWTGMGSGLTPANVIGCHVHKHRLYVWEGASLSFWYGATDTIGGTFTEFPLGYISTLGGRIVAMGTWSTDTGAGPDDYAVFILSSGQTVVYQGSDPGDAAAWALVGIYNIGAPLGPRAVVKIGGDLRITTFDDYVSLGALSRGQQMTRIKSGLQEAAKSAPDRFGWQSIAYPRGGMVIHNVPLPTGDFEQHVQSLETGAWCRFKDIPAACWGLYVDRAHFGHASNGTVYRFDDGNDDDGAAIAADARQAWSDLGYPGRKRFTAVRLLVSSLRASGSYEYGLGYDYQDARVTQPTAIQGDGALWDLSPWDTTPWSAETSVDDSWRAASGHGQAVSVRMLLSTKIPVNWFRTDFRFEPGVNL